MAFDDVWAKIGHLRYSSREHCKTLWDLVVETSQTCENNLPRVLELGFAYGKTVCVMAAAGAFVDCVDLAKQEWQHPTVEENLMKVGLSAYVSTKAYREAISYNWWLVQKIKQRSGCYELPCYDIIFLDGSHNVYTDTGAFYLSERLLKPGGYFVIDDLSWTHHGAMDGRYVWGLDTMKMSGDERHTPHMRLLWEYCIKQHPNLYNFQEIDGWLAIARKR